MTVTINCSGCEKVTTIPEKGTDGRPYEFFRCRCGHETEMKS